MGNERLRPTAAELVNGGKMRHRSSADLLFPDVRQLHGSAHLPQLLGHHLHHSVQLRPLQHVAGVAFNGNPVAQSLKQNPTARLRGRVLRRRGCLHLIYLHVFFLVAVHILGQLGVGEASHGRDHQQDEGRSGRTHLCRGRTVQA